MDLLPKILIVDDKYENLVALEAILKHLPVSIIKAKSGIEALTATLEHDFALALLDVQMPVMDGYELAGILRERKKTAGLPFIFISAVYTLNLNVFEGYEQGAFSFLTKPLQADLLINKVNFFIEKHEQEVALGEMNKNLAAKNERLEALNSELEAYTYTVSHDLRAPLRALNGYSHILLEDFGDHIPAKGKKLLDMISANALKMGKLIDSLLTLSYLGRQDLMKNKVDMNALVKEIVNEISEKNEKTRFNISELPEVLADKALLRQVLVNLISNAVKYSGKKETPVIEIGYQSNDGSTIYYIKDNGAGFDMKYYDKLFGVFQRLHSSEEFEGTGAGLAIVERIITKHGGKIRAEAIPEEGATFYFSL
ncbi:MAG: ATP-binding protein [Bacteroidota bacterium]